MSQPFFITGLPRSRTSWLANLFTYGKSYCGHDMTHVGPDFDSEMERLGREFSYVGNSDSGLLTGRRLVIKKYPAARWLIIHRDMKEACESFIEFFRERPYINQPKDADCTRMVFQMFQKSLDVIEADLHASQVMKCRFDQLEDNSVLERIWYFLTPENPWNLSRCQLLQRLRINPASDKIRIHL